MFFKRVSEWTSHSSEQAIESGTVGQHKMDTMFCFAVFGFDFEGEKKRMCCYVYGEGATSRNC